MKIFLKIIPLIWFCSGTTQAVIIAAGDGSGNTTTPPDDPGFANIGTLNGASVIYLGNGWVMTADHVAGSLPASVQLGGGTYSTATGTFHQLTNGGTPGMTTLTDMVVFRLASDPGLPWLSIRSAVPTVGNAITMIGNGRDRATDITYWDASWAVLPSSSGAAYSGFQSVDSHSVRWGENQVSFTGLNLNDGVGDIRSFGSDFTSGGLANEAQAVVGDSGGAVFIKNGSTWELSGMMYAVNTYSGQPDPGYTAVFGDETAVADLSFYRDQILSITDIPEPSTYLIGAAVLPLMAFRRRR